MLEPTPVAERPRRYTVGQLIKLGIAERGQTYSDVVKAVFGRNAAYSLNTLKLISCIGSLVAYVRADRSRGRANALTWWAASRTGDIDSRLQRRHPGPRGRAGLQRPARDFAHHAGAPAPPPARGRAEPTMGAVQLVVLPLSMQRSLNSLRFVAFLSMLIVTLYMVRPRSARHTAHACDWGLPSPRRWQVYTVEQVASFTSAPGEQKDVVLGGASRAHSANVRA